MDDVLFVVTKSTELDELFEFLEGQDYNEKINLPKVEERIFDQDTWSDIYDATGDDPICSVLIDRLTEYELIQLKAHVEKSFNQLENLANTRLRVLDFIENVLPTLIKK